MEIAASRPARSRSGAPAESQKCVRHTPRVAHERADLTEASVDSMWTATPHGTGEPTMVKL